MAKKKEMRNKNANINQVPKGWKILPLGEVFDFISSYAVSRENLTTKKTKRKIQNIHYGDIHAKFNNEILDLSVEDELPFIKDEALNGNKFSYLKDGDLIIADVSEDYEGLGECVEIKNVGRKKIVGGLHTFVVRSKNGKIAPGFGCYIFKNPSVRLELKKIATGSNVYSISKKNLSELKIILPPFSENTKIAKILAGYDKTLDLTEKLITAKEKRKKVLMEQLLTGKKRIKGFRREKWETIILKEKYSINNEILSEKTPLYKEFFYLDLSSVKEGNINFPSEKIRFEGAPSRARRILKRNNVILATVRPNLKGFAVADFETNGIICSTGFALINTSDKWDAYFLYNLVNSPIISSQIENLVVGSNYPAINNSDVENIIIPFPTKKDERDNIAKIFFTCDTEISTLKNKLNALKQQKRGLMQALLTGKKRVKTNKK